MKHKRKASAKQIAWRKEFASRAKSGSWGNVRKKVKRSYSAPKVMAKRRSSGRKRSGGRGRFGLGGLKGLFVKAAAGVGGATIGTTLAGQFMPGIAPIAGIGGAYVAGGIPGVIANVVLGGGLGNLGGLLGGGSAGGGEAI